MQDGFELPACGIVAENKAAQFCSIHAAGGIDDPAPEAVCNRGHHFRIGGKQPVNAGIGIEDHHPAGNLL